MPFPASHETTGAATQAEATLMRRFGGFEIDGAPNGAGPRRDYLIRFHDAREASLLAQDMRASGIACGIRQEPGRTTLRLSRDDLMAAMQGETIGWLEADVMALAG